MWNGILGIGAMLLSAYGFLKQDPLKENLRDHVTAAKAADLQREHWKMLAEATAMLGKTEGYQKASPVEQSVMLYRHLETLFESRAKGLALAAEAIAKDVGRAEEKRVQEESYIVKTLKRDLADAEARARLLQEKLDAAVAEADAAKVDAERRAVELGEIKVRLGGVGLDEVIERARRAGDLGSKNFGLKDMLTDARREASRLRRENKKLVEENKKLAEGDLKKKIVLSSTYGKFGESPIKDLNGTEASKSAMKHFREKFGASADLKKVPKTGSKKGSKKG